MKEFFDEAFDLESGPSEIEVERMQLQSAMAEVDTIANEIQELLYRNRYYGDEFDYQKIEDLHRRLKMILKIYS